MKENRKTIADVICPKCKSENWYSYSTDDIDFDYDDYGDYSDSEIEEYSDEDDGKTYRDFNSQPITSLE